MRPARLLSVVVSAALILTLGFTTPASATTNAPQINASATSADTTGDVLLAWKPVQGAQRYRVEVREDTATSGTPYLTADTTALSWAPSEKTLGASGTSNKAFYWRVAAVYSSGEIVWGEFGSFPRGPLQSSGTKYTPNGTVRYPAEDVAFAWPDVQGAKGYKFEYTTEDSFSNSNAVKTAIVTTTSYTPDFAINRLDGDGNEFVHRWRVTPLDGKTQTSSAIAPASGEQEFTVVWENSQPSLTFPADGAELNFPSFEWEPVKGAKSYLVSLRGLADSVVNYTAVVSGTEFTPPGQFSASGYYWSVTALDANGKEGLKSLSREVNLRYGSNFAQISAGALAAPKGAISSTGIDWSKAVGGNEIEVKLSELSFAWAAVPRASYYHVQASTEGKLDDSKSCLTSSTEVMPTTGEKVFRSAEMQFLSTNCMMNNIDPTNKDNFQVGSSYSWRVMAYNGDARAQKKPAKGVQDRSRSLWSAVFNFKIIPEDGELAPTYGLEIVDENILPISEADNSPSIASPSPLLKWNRVSNLPLTRVTVRRSESITETLVGEAFVYGANSVRLNAILRDLNTTQPYRVTLTPCYPTLVCSTAVYDSEITYNENGEIVYEELDPETPEGEVVDPRPKTNFAGRFRKLTHAVEFSEESKRAEFSTDDFSVRWDDYSHLYGTYAGSEGYLVTIHKENDLSGTPVHSERVESNSWQYAQGVTTDKNNLKLEYGVDYRLRVAVLDGYGKPATENSGIKFKLANPTPPEPTSVVSANGITLHWDETAAATKYAISYAPQSGGSWTNVGFVSNKPALTQRTISINRPSPGTYKWRIHTLDRNGALSVVNVDDLIEVYVPTSTPQLTTGNATVLSPDKRLLKWNSVAGASSYNVYTGSIQTSLNLVANTTQKQLAPIGTSKAWSTSSDFAFNKSYHWRVDAINAAGTVVGQSEVRSFSVTTVPSKPSLSGLANSGTSITAKIALLAADKKGSANDAKFGYELQYRESSDVNGAWKSIPKTLAAAGEITVSGLKRATSYVFRVRALNSVGASDWSATKTASTIDVPSTPTLRSATSTLDTVSLSWAAGSGTNKPVSYKVRYRPSSTNTWTTKSVTSTSLKLTGLKSGTTHYYEIVGVNAVGEGPASAGSIKTSSVPSVPTGLSVKAGDKKATISWKAPSAGSSKITKYVVQSREYNSKTKKWSSWKQLGTSTATKYSASKLKNGTKYQIRVSAVSSVGAGAFTAAKTVTPVGKPIAPKVTATSKKKKQITIKWSGAQANGTKITSYRVQVSTNGKKWATVKKAKASAKSYTWKKAKAGKKYQVRVLTYNKLGNTASSKVTVTVKK